MLIRVNLWTFGRKLCFLRQQDVACPESAECADAHEDREPTEVSGTAGWKPALQDVACPESAECADAHGVREPTEVSVTAGWKPALLWLALLALFGCAAHYFNGFMGNEGVARPGKECALRMLDSFTSSCQIFKVQAGTLAIHHKECALRMVIISRLKPNWRPTKVSVTIALAERA